MKKTETINLVQFDWTGIPLYKKPAEAIRFDFPLLPNEVFYYMKGKAYGQTCYILIEGKTGMEFSRGDNMKELQASAEKRVKDWGIAKIEQLIKDMVEKYKSLPIVEPETIDQ